MLKGTTFAQCISENEILLKNTINSVYQTANSILMSHPLYKYFEQYLGGYLIIMEPEGDILVSEENETLSVPQTVGYIHPLDREKYTNAAKTKAQSLLNSDCIRSFDALSEQAGAIKLDNGLIFSYSGFEFLELKDSNSCDSYEDIFEAINLYTLLTSDFFRPEVKVGFDPRQYRFGDNENTEENVIREAILFSLSQEELIDISTKISTTGLHYNFSLLNEIFLSKVLLKTGFIDLDFIEKSISVVGKKFGST